SASTRSIGSRQHSPPVAGDGSKATVGCSAATVSSRRVSGSTTARSRMSWMTPLAWRSPPTGTKPRLRRSRTEPSTSSRPSPGSAGEAGWRELGERTLFASADVTSEGEVATAVARAVERFGALHVAVNCAGVGAAMKTVGKDGPMPLAVFAKVIEVNLIGTFNVTRLAAAQMAKNAPNDA